MVANATSGAISDGSPKRPIGIFDSAGLAMHGLIVGRNDDVFGIGVGFARVSESAIGLDLDRALYSPSVFSPALHYGSVRHFGISGASSCCSTKANRWGVDLNPWSFPFRAASI
jgi:hypothetical protein